MDREQGMDSNSYRYEEEEDHESIYIGVPASRGYRRRRRRRRSSMSSLEAMDAERAPCDDHRQREHRDPEPTSPEQAEHSLDISRNISPAAERLRYILGDAEDATPTPTLFTEMDTLQHEGDELEWRESARWVKFEEKVEEGGERWSKPHVSTLSLHSLFELRTCLQTGVVLLDLDGYSLPQIVDDIIERHVEEGVVGPELRDKISFVLLRKHRHQTKKPIHHSLADLGKGSSAPSRSLACALPSAFSRSTEDLRSCGHLRHTQSRSMNDISYVPSTEQLKNRFMKKIPRDAEASNVLVGEVDFLPRPFVAFVRLAQATTLGGLTEVPVPTRFLFVLLGPPDKAKSYSEIGRAIATLMVDDLFSDVAYKARDRDDLIAGIDEFLDEVIVLPPGEWDPNIRIEPPKKVPSAEQRKSAFSLNELGQTNCVPGTGGADKEMPMPHELGEELLHTGRFCGGLLLDIKRKLPWYFSDFYQGFHIQSLSAVLFIYMGCVTNAITFGGLLGDATDNYQGVMESFLGTALAGAVFCLLGGQPLIILSSTGPILIFEKLLYDFSKSSALDYMELRLWVGMHACLQCLVLVAADASCVIRYVTRFTEEGFSSLISLIFISDAVKKMAATFRSYPIDAAFSPERIAAYKCECVAPDSGDISLLCDTTPSPSLDPPRVSASQTNLTALDWSQLGKSECVKYGGSLVGNSCGYVPDLALLSFILFFGTYSTTVSLKKFKFTRYFPTKVRKLISDFSIFMSIVTFVGLDMAMGLKTPKLIVPTEFKPTRPDRGWLVMPFGKNPWWVSLASFAPALLVTILVFMDQQISAVIVNRKENKLKKGCGYHLDLFWVGVLLALCSLVGLPWYVAATVISIAHIDSLRMESESSAPGEQPQFLGVREQRMTGILVFVLTGTSIFLAPVLQLIPMPVLYGVFFYMGVASLSGIQFWDRVKLFLMPAKHQPDHDYLRHVPLRRVHLFTLLQITCLAALWALKSTVLAIIFPVMILGLMLVRKLLDAAFSQHDLAWLDDLLPWPKRTRSNRRNCGGGKDGDMDGEKRLWWSGCDPGAADLGYRVGEEGDVWSATPTPVLQRRGHASGPRPSDVPSIASPLPPPLSRTGNGTLASRGITLHLKISCPPSPGAEAGGIQLALPQVKIEIESEDDDTDAELRDWECERGNEMTL
ncbi:electrogenic sodium bicarbonate cotransporter 4 [Electrophorus electricus]|uniref:electrogenic sodium bicarbonate cotransporter 4 n=1 Tax=Electrophorus electricus TaxID=8005 RepID=UPI0015D018EE|nr:electrogenic sodium bicarbonate cotransporter 4 [Electrophorus electricus]